MSTPHPEARRTCGDSVTSQRAPTIGAGAARTTLALLSDWFASLMPTDAVRALRGLLVRDGTVAAGFLAHSLSALCEAVRAAGDVLTVHARSSCGTIRHKSELKRFGFASY